MILEVPIKDEMCCAAEMGDHSLIGIHVEAVKTIYGNIPLTKPPTMFVTTTATRYEHEHRITMRRKKYIAMTERKVHLLLHK